MITSITFCEMTWDPVAGSTVPGGEEWMTAARPVLFRLAHVEDKWVVVSLSGIWDDDTSKPMLAAPFHMRVFTRRASALAWARGMADMKDFIEKTGPIMDALKKFLHEHDKPSDERN